MLIKMIALFSCLFSMLGISSNSSLFVSPCEEINISNKKYISKEDKNVEDSNDIQHYYNELIEEIESSNINAYISYSDYCESFAKRDISLEEFNNLLIQDMINYPELFSNVQTFSNIDISGSWLASSPDADYILLNDENPAFTPDSQFRRIPIYGGYNGHTFDYSTLQPGDIIVENVAPYGHAAIVVNTDHAADSCHYVQTVEAVGSGVHYGFLDDWRMVEYNVSIFRVENATFAQKNFAVEFCLMQLGKPYSIDFTNVDNSTADEWYCSELIYAAYYSSNVDIGKQYFRGLLGSYGAIYLPEDIDKAWNTYEINMINAHMPNVQLVKGSAWTINIHNDSRETMIVEYNSKMCFGYDAEDWNNLNDIKRINISIGGYQQVRISPNWFATHLAISSIYGNMRYILFIDNLKSDPVYKMRVSYTMKVI